jgi:hypothetical protein
VPAQGEETVASFDLMLVGVPVGIAGRAREWFDALLREFDIIASEGDVDGPPRRLIGYVRQVRERFSRFSGQSDAAYDRALSEGRDSFDQVLTLPVTAGAAASELLVLVEEAVRFCDEGELLTLAAPDDVLRFTGWYLTEVARQSDGATPEPWSAPRSANGLPPDRV